MRPARGLPRAPAMSPGHVTKPVRGERLPSLKICTAWLTSDPGKRRGGKSRPLPFSCKRNLEHRGNGQAAIRFIALVSMALTAELRRLIAAGGSAGGVIRSANEEHGRVVSAGQAGVAGRGSGRAGAGHGEAIFHLNHIHKVLVVAGGAHHGGFVVVGLGADEETIIHNELRGVR